MCLLFAGKDTQIWQHSLNIVMQKQGAIYLILYQQVKHHPLIFRFLRLLSELKEPDRPVKHPSVNNTFSRFDTFFHPL